MRVSLRRPPTVLERLLGRRRVKSLRRRIGLVAIGAGVSLVRPRVSLTHVAVIGAVVFAVFIAALRL